MVIIHSRNTHSGPLENSLCWHKVRTWPSLLTAEVMQWPGDQNQTHTPHTHPLRQDGPLVTISVLTRASVLWAFEVKAPGTAEVGIHNTLSSRARILYPKELFLHCTALPQHHKTKQGAQTTLPWNTSGFSITLSSHRPSGPVPLCPGRGQVPAEPVASCPWTWPGEKHLSILGKEASPTWDNEPWKDRMKGEVRER